MIKKIITSALTAIITITSVMTGNFSTAQNGIDSLSETQFNDKQIDYELKATNSLGKYITKSSEENDINPDLKLLADIENDTFSVTNLGFDAESGMLIATSSQKKECILVFSFVDEVTNETVQEVKKEVKEGEYVSTEAKADVAALPQYYLVQAQLVDKKGKVLSNTFKLDKYIKIMQEISDTNIHDFNAEQVVNFDENEDNNFIVLSEDTIKAESSESENTLVTADYDSGTFVFENIDDTIHYLQSGDLFYIQPDDENVIAVSVDEVDIDGDTATIKGSNNIDEMFDFIKLETQVEDGDIQVDTTVSDEGVFFPDYEEEIFTHSLSQPLDFRINRKNFPIRYSDDAEISVRFPKDDIFDDKFFGADVDVYGALSFKSSFNFYKKKGYTSAGLSITCGLDFTFKFGVEGNLSSDMIKSLKDKSGKSIPDGDYEYIYNPDRIHGGDHDYIYDPEKNKDKIEKYRDLERRFDLCDIKIPIGIMGVYIDIKPALVVSLTGSLELTASINFVFGFKYNSKDDKIQRVSNEDRKNFNLSLELEGEFFIGLQFTPELVLIHRKLLAVAFEATFGIVATVETNIDLRDAWESRNREKSESGRVVITDKKEDYYHSCALCFYSTVAARLHFGMTATIVSKKFSLPVEATLDFPLPFDWCESCFGITSLDPYDTHKDYRVAYADNPEEKVCPHRKYRVEFLASDTATGAAIDGVVITLEGLKQTTSGGKAVFYCDNGSYSYSAEYAGESTSGSFSVDNCKHPENVEFTLSTDDNGILKVDDIKTSGGEETKNPPVTTTAKTVEPVITETVCNADEQIYESVQLGENIWGFVYPDDSMYIYGSGDMYSDRNLSIKNVKNIKEVVFNDNDPENGEYITSIGNHLFDGAENLEVVYISNEIKSIGDYAFCGCKKLKAFRYGGENDTSESLVFPSKLKSIGKWAFIFCDDVPFGDIVFGNELQTIGVQAFQGDKGITSVYIPESVTYINSSAFEECSNIKKVDIRAKAEKIRGFLYRASSLEELIVPSFMTVNDSKNLANIFNDNEDGAYNSTEVPESLKKVTVLSGDAIPDGALNGFGVAETIAVPAGIKSIGKNAFPGFSATNIICSDESQNLSFSELFKDVEVIGEKAFIGNKVPIGDLVFGDKLTSIGHQAFQEATGITSVYIPESVTSMGVCVFEKCSNLKKAVIKANIDDYRGIFYRTNSMEELTLPSFITIRGSHSLSQLFNDNEDGAYNSTEVPKTLNKVAILSGETIPDGAFSGLGSVTTFALPEGIKKVGSNAFEWCNVEQIICSDDTKELSFSEVFKDVESIGNYAFRSCNNLQLGDIVFGNNLKSLGVGCFNGTSKLTSIELNGVDTIGFGAFEGCASLKKVTIRGDIKSITGGLFYNSSSLEELILPTFIETKDRFNLYGNDQLRILFCDNEDVPWNDIKIPEGFKKLTILNGESMPKNYLNSLYNVTAIGLPEELNFVDVHASQDLQKLDEIIYNGTDDQWENIDIREQNDPLRKTKRVLPTEEEHIYGDANGDGEIDMSDAVLIMQALANPNKYGVNGTDQSHITSEGFKYADTDGNGLTVNDALRIQQYLLGLIPSLA